MDIGEYQRWVEHYDQQRDLDLVEPSQVTVHLCEEVGEIAREILYLEGYRNPTERADAVSRLAEEVGDVLVFITKLAIEYGISLEEVAKDTVTKAEGRWPLALAQAEMARYIDHQEQAGQARTGAWRARHPAGNENTVIEET